MQKRAVEFLKNIEGVGREVEFPKEMRFMSNYVEGFHK
jgi:hypothetical protein